MAIWTSADGRSWKAVDLAETGVAGSMLSSIRRTDHGWLAVGVRINGQTIDGAVWRSTDLHSWQPIPDGPVLAGPEEIDLAAVHAFAGGYLAIGITGKHEDRLNCEGVGGDGGRVAMVGDLGLICGWGRRVEWWSADGVTWQLLPRTMDQAGDPLGPARPDGRGLMDYGPVRAGGPGLVTIGYDFAGRLGSEDIRGIWTTADGRFWNPVGVASQFPPDATVTDMSIVGRRIVAVGYATTPLRNGPDQGSREDAAAWIGTVLP
jgi:hypothetical protein